MEVVGGHFRSGQFKRLNFARFYRNDSVLILQESPDLQESVMNDNRVVSFKELRRDDDVGYSCFVFQTQEHKSFGSAGALANNHRSDNLHRLSVRKMFQDASGRNAKRIQLCTMLS